MFSYKRLLCIIIVFYSFTAESQDIYKYNKFENEYEKIFKDFKQYLTNSINNNVDVLDTANIKSVLLNFILSDSPLDTTDLKKFKKNEIPENRIREFKIQYGMFYQYLFERKNIQLIEHIKAIPLRLYSYKCIYEMLTPFQKENTFVYFDERHIEKPLGYMLFVPRIKNTVSAPRIWAWCLTFESGKWAYKTPMGILGMELLIADGLSNFEQ